MTDDCERASDGECGESSQGLLASLGKSCVSGAGPRAGAAGAQGHKKKRHQKGRACVMWRAPERSG